ncbi:helix-turn-helix domain-containing protein [Corynebacterium lizhenjunii]|uniref:AlbA family DNA-binding domain-containing protein n=1 Tax=Corynebacterium lizhenjunii TaxID=2709394 RepID=UPI0013EAF6F5|nr:ATP-binding protein [Corynebacterium lizhenjunii]
MFTPIHRALGIEAGELNSELIQKAIDERVEEASDLDWKRDFYNPKHPGWDEEAAKDLAAMANTGGGWIVFGVAEDGVKNSACEVSPITWSADKQQRLLRVAYAKVGPPLVGLEFHEVPWNGVDGSGSIVMLRVPDSPDAPHFARKGDGAFVAPRRNGPHTVFMSDREIERGFRERFQYADDQERLLQNRFEQACGTLRPENGLVLSLAAVPYEPVLSRKPLTKEVVSCYADQRGIPELFSRNYPLWYWGSGEVKKGLRQWVLRNRPESHISYRKNLFDDGTVLGSYQVGLLYREDEHSEYYPVGGVNHCLNADLEAAVIDFVTILRSHAQERQVGGGFRLRAGLVGVANEPIHIRTLNKFERLDEVERGEPISRFQPITTELAPLAEVNELLPIVSSFAQDLINQGGVQRLTVIPEENDERPVTS